MTIKQSRVGAELSDTITRRVILMIILMLIILPWILVSEVDHILQLSVSTLHDYNKNAIMDPSNADLPRVFAQFQSCE